MNRAAMAATMILCSFASLQAADGVRTLPDSAAAMGMVGGRLANLHDPSVTRANPANLVLIKDSAFMLTLQPWYGQTSFTGQTGVTDSMSDPWKPLGSMYVALPVNDRVVFGLGVTAPFGISISWPVNGAFRYNAPYKATLQTAALNPAVGIEICDRVAFGIGLDVFYSRLRLDQLYPWAAVLGAPAPDGDMTFEGDGWGVGAYAGFTIKLAEHHRLSLTGRLPVKVRYRGQFSISNTPPALAAALGLTDNSSFGSEITHPGGFGVGYGVDVTDNLTFGIDFEWTNNSAHKNVPLQIGNNAVLLPSDKLVLNWRDSWNLGCGMEYKLTPSWMLRAGYLFSKSPLRDSTYTPSIPTNDRHIISIGTGYTRGRSSIDFAYSFVPMKTRHVSGANTPSFDGDYNIQWHVLTLSYTRRF